MEQIYTVEQCANLLVKIAAIAQDITGAGPYNEMPNSATGDPSMGAPNPGGPDQATEQMLVQQNQQQQQKFTQSKDQLYERLLREKDIMSKLKIRLVATGQQSFEDVEALEEPLGSGIQPQPQQPQSPDPNGYTPMPLGSGLEARAALKRALEKKSVAPLAVAGTALTAATAYQGAKGARDLTNLAHNATRDAYEGGRNILIRNRVSNNPLLAREEIENAYMRDRVPIDNSTFFSEGGRSLDRPRNLFGPGPKVPNAQKYANQVLPKAPKLGNNLAGNVGSSGGKLAGTGRMGSKADYNA